MSEDEKTATTPIQSEIGSVVGYAIGTELSGDKALEFMSERLAAMQGIRSPSHIIASPAVMKALAETNKKAREADACGLGFQRLVARSQRRHSTF